MNTPKTEPKTKTRGAVIVTRVSTGEQDKHGTSPETQLEACRAKAAALGVPIIAEYYDAAISGAFLASRSGMQAALAVIREGRADTLICPNMSRYSRDAEHQQSIRKEVRAAGGRVVFCDMEFADTPEGDLAFGIFGSFAEYERKVIRERTMKGRRKRAEGGVQSSRAFAPYGYHIPTKADVLGGLYPAEQLGKYVLVPEKARIAKWILESYAAGTHSLYGLMKELNARNVPTPSGGALWQRTSIRGLLLNPIYKGTFISGQWENYQDEGRLQETNKVTGRPYTTPSARRPRPPEEWIVIPCPAVVDEQTWERVQQQVARNRERRGGNPSRVKMLSGHVFCPECSARMQLRKADTRKGEASDAYLCSSYQIHLNNAGQRPCSGTRYLRVRIEAAVIEALADACARREMIATALAAYATPLTAPPIGTDPAEESSRLDAALADLEEDEMAAVYAQIAGIRAGASPDTYAQVFADLAARRKDLLEPPGSAVAGGKTGRRPASHTDL